MKQNILNLISRAFNDKPRKVSYEALIDFIQQHPPSGYDAYDFMEEIFTPEGHLTPESILYILFQLGILKKSSGECVKINVKVEVSEKLLGISRKWSEIFRTKHGENSRKSFLSPREKNKPLVGRKRSESKVVKSVGNFFKKILRKIKK